MRHADRDRLVGGGERLGHREAGGSPPGKRLDHGREVGAGVGEQPVDAARLEQRQIGLGDGLDFARGLSHLCHSPCDAW